MSGWRSSLVALALLCGCEVNIASLPIAAPQRPDPAAVRTAVSLGWRDGESCRLWVLGVPFGLPQVDEAISDALAPVHGAFMRDVTVWSVHPVYVAYGWHCYRVRGEAFG